MGKTKSKVKKKKRRLLDKAMANGTANKRVLKTDLQTMVRGEEHEQSTFFGH